MKFVAVKLLDCRATLRLTATAEQKTDGSSEKLCVKHRDAIVKSLRDSIYAKTVGTIRDPDSPDENPGIYRIRIGDTFGVRSDVSGEPHLHRASVEVSLQFKDAAERQITTITTGLDINYEAAFA